MIIKYVRVIGIIVGELLLCWTVGFVLFDEFYANNFETMQFISKILGAIFGVCLLVITVSRFKNK